MNIEMRRLESDYNLIPNEGLFEVMGLEGDSKYIWDKTKPVEVEIAKSTFIKKGYLAFKVSDEKGNKGEQALEFDPEAERYIFSPPMQGG